MGGFAAQFDIFCADYDNSALQSYREVNRNPRADAEAHHNLAWACANALVCMYWQIDAVAEFEKVLRLRPGYLEARHGLARALHKKGDLERAVSEYEKTIEADPQAAGVASIYFDLGDALLAKGETGRATAVYGMVLRADPNDPLAGAKLVHAAMQGPGAEGAAAKLLHLQKEYPHLAELHQALGTIWLEECKLDEAIRELREAVRLKPQLHFAREQLASALAYKGDAAGFIAEASEARRLNPYPKAHGDFGVIPDESRDFYLSWVAQNAGQCKPAKSSLPPPPPMAAEAESQVTVPQRIRVSRAVQASQLVSKVEPIYPPLAEQARIQGTVELEAVIGKDGTIQNLTVLRGPPLLVQAALDAARQWRYQPTRVNNEPVEVVTVIEVVFRLRSSQL
jgi:TonB family protein